MATRCSPSRQTDIPECVVTPLGYGVTILRGRKGNRRNNCSEFSLENSCGASVSTSDIAHALASCDLSAPRHTPDQIEDGFVGRFSTALPESMVHVLTPDFAIEPIQFVVVIADIPERHRT
jgi:hypothetical protein